MTGSRPSTTFRATAAWLVGLWLFGLIGWLAHASHGEHRYCSEHGAFEEAGAGLREGARGHGETLRAATPEDGTHETCPFAGPVAPFEPEDPVALAPPVATPPPVDVVVPARPFVAPAIPLLAVAPKSSPPSVAL
jgi:hypothetical protein